MEKYYFLAVRLRPQTVAPQRQIKDNVKKCFIISQTKLSNNVICPQPQFQKPQKFVNQWIISAKNKYGRYNNILEWME